MDMAKLDSEGACCRLHVARLRLDVRMTGIEKQSQDFGARQQLMHHFQPLRPQPETQVADAGEIAAGLCKTADKTTLDRVEAPLNGALRVYSSPMIGQSLSIAHPSAIPVDTA